MRIRSVLTLAISLACIWLASSVLAQSPYRQLRKGGRMTPAAAAESEQALAEDPWELVSRVRLIGYYSRLRFTSEEARERCNAHVLWFVRNEPETNVLAVPEARIDRHFDAAVYAEAEALWNRHLETSPDSVGVLRNASKFFMFSNRRRAITLLERAQRLTPASPVLARELGHMQSLDVWKNGAPDAETAARALKQFQRAYDLLNEDEADSLLGDLAKTAVLAGQKETARAYAESMLQNDSRGWNLGNRIHHGHLTLGRIELAEGDLEKAKDRLLKAGGTPGFPQLNSFGPNMLLAKELLERGEQEVVLRYFELCSKFWGMGREKLAAWTQQVREGKIPDFGANLFY